MSLRTMKKAQFVVPPLGRKRLASRNAAAFDACGLKAGLRTDFPRRAWNDGAEKIRPRYCSMASIGSLHHRYAGRRESPVRLDMVYDAAHPEPACHAGGCPMGLHIFRAHANLACADQCLPG